LIVFAHLYNDRSGSTRVLCSAIAALGSLDEERLLYIGSEGEGLLSEIEVPRVEYWFRSSRFRSMRGLVFLFSQSCLFARLLLDRRIPPRAVIYVNTLLPFGAALYGKLTGRPVIYHLHESSVRSGPMLRLLTAMVRWTSTLNIYVSDTHRRGLPIPGVPARTIANALDGGFVTRALAHCYRHRHNGRFNVLMIATLRDYKGVPELLGLARTLADRPDIHFDLLVNDDRAGIAHYFARRELPANVRVHAGTNDTSPFYQNASLVVNLSRIDQIVETFGMTILEAMTYGIPVIVPPEGGPTELVTPGIEGYWIDSREGKQLRDRVLWLADSPQVCVALSTAAREKAGLFNGDRYAGQIREAIGGIDRVGGGI